MIDSHCHLDFEAFDGDRQQVIERARRAGVTGILNPGIDLDSASSLLACAARFPEVVAAVGVHPNSATTWNADSLERLRTLARRPKVLAIGEIGLDYYRDRAPQSLQREILRLQLDLAGELNLPVVVHIRNRTAEDHQATVDTLAALAEWIAELARRKSPLCEHPGVLHSFSDNAEAAQKAVELGLYIGISGPVTFRNGQQVQQVVGKIPLEKILIETDAPFLTPHPHRGKRNEPAHVGLVADKIAEIHNLQPHIVAQTTASNALRLFDWKVIS